MSFSFSKKTTALSEPMIKRPANMISRRLFGLDLVKLVLLAVILQSILSSTCFVNGERVEILMSNVTTQEEDAYLCTSYKLGDDQKYITNVEPLTNADVAHHMFAFGCEKPASTSNSWNCGSVVCQGPKTILFAWGRNAPELKLPDDVAFKVGPQTSYKYIVVNIHYLKKVDNDRSGLAISVTNKPRRYQAGIMLLVSSNINIPPKVPKYSSDFSCKYEGKNLNVFAFRVHAHMHGDVNAAYRVRNHEWVQLAKGDPQWPQAFYPLDNTLDLKDGDAVVGRCTYHNDENRYVTAGSTHTDEMCNVYLMYYSDSTEGVQEICYGNTYPALEEIIPSDAQRRPAPPSTMKLNDDGTRKDIMSHHDMEGSKLHHDLSDLFKGNGGSNSNNKDQKSLAYILSQGSGSSAADDYYNDVETSRSKSRTNGNGKGSGTSNDYDALTDDLIGADSGSSSSDDYDSAALLAAAVAEQLNSASSGNSKKNDLSNKIKNLIQQQPITITKYSLIENWYDQKAANLGQIGGIAINQKNENIVVFHRGAQVWQMDSFNDEYRFNTKKYKVIDSDTIVTMNRNTGKVVNSWGANLFYMPHGLTIDSSGNIWVTDVGRHQVLKFAPNSTQPILEVGKRMEPGNDKTHFCQPADVAVLRNGDFYVADGYCNSRIVKFNKNGEYITEWSSDDQGLPSHFFVPHSLALHESQNLICVADRENYRVQCFDLNGNFLFETSSAEFGPIYSVAFAANNASVLYAVNGFNSKLENQFDKKIFLISTKTGKLIGSINLNEDAHTPHDLVLSDDASEIYIADLNPALVFKYALVNYNFGKPDKRKLGNNTKDLVLNKDNVDGDKENFRTSMFIMTFLAVPVIFVIVVALVVRLKNTGRLKSMKLGGVGSKIDAKHKELGKWITNKTNSKKRNGFTRLNQESDDEEAQHLNRNGSSGSNDINRNTDDSESGSEGEAPMPTLSNA